MIVTRVWTWSGEPGTTIDEAFRGSFEDVEVEPRVLYLPRYPGMPPPELPLWIRVPAAL